MMQSEPLALDAACCEFLSQHGVSKLVLGLSGGRDSVALLLCLLDYGFSVHACHLNHALRGKEAVADAQFCAQLCTQLGVSFALQVRDVPAIAAACGRSFELVARELRREFLMAEARCVGANVIALAQHADDQAETVLFRLGRGAAGVRAMSPVVEQEGFFWLRPFLSCRRAALTAFLQARGQRWREDASNACCDYARNRIRHEVIPALSLALGRDVVPVISRSATLAGAQAEALSEALNLLEPTFYDPQGRLFVPALQACGPPLARAVIHRFLQQQGVTDISCRLVDEVFALLLPQCEVSCVNLPGAQRLRRAHKRLFLDMRARL